MRTPVSSGPFRCRTANLIVYEYTGQGFLPVKIDPKPLSDLGNVKFLGTEIADQHPIVKTWAVGSPARVPLDSMITGKGFYKPRDEMTFDGSYPIIEGYRGHARAGLASSDGRSAAIQSAQRQNVSYSPAGDLDSGQQFHGDISYRTLEWHFTYWHNNANFLRSVRTHRLQPQGRRPDRGLQEDPALRSAAPVRFHGRCGTFTPGSTRLPGAQNIQSHDPSIATVQARTQLHQR